MKFVNDLNFTFELYPYEHVVIDNFIKEEYINELLEEMDNLTLDKSYYYGDQNIEKNKYAFNKHFGEKTQELFQEINSDEFITLLENKTGITGLIRNNLELKGAGVHKVLNNGFLTMHKDFEGYNDAKYGLLDRRINLLLYMNNDWKQEYGDELCLYDKKINKITKKILPILNRCVIFLTPGNIHGHPKPLTIPENKSRQSITTYYYTKNITGYNLDGQPIQPVTWFRNISE
jgi:Rps23 Pro-64 3,4-dihydroxylase Tpa1-like proline 4-hydroxylase